VNNLNTPDAEAFILHHVGVEEGLPGGNTIRVNLWWDGEATPVYMLYLSRLCDELAIGGVEDVVKAIGEDHIKGRLVIDKGVDTANAASMWINSCNGCIAELSQSSITLFSESSSVRDAMAVSSSDTFSWSGSDGAN